MIFEKTSLINLFILIGFASVFWDIAPTKKVLYQEYQDKFKSDCNTGIDAPTRIDGRISLNTDSPEHKGSVKWNETIAVQSVKNILSVVVR